MNDRYYAGSLNDFGGGNVGWWHDYIRAELERSHEHYQAELASLREQNAALRASLKEWRDSGPSLMERDKEVAALKSRLAAKDEALRGCASVLRVARDGGPWPDAAAGLEEEVLRALAAQEEKPL